MAGYSDTTFAKKLGIKETSLVVLVNAPREYRSLLEPLPPAVQFAAHVSKSVDLVHVFSAERAQLQSLLARYRSLIKLDAVVWVSWPKKSAKVPTDITEDTIREVSLPLGFVDVKVCAVDDIWSGLKLVIRKHLR